MVLQPEIALNGFSEGDQANLWQTLTDSKTKSCQGLGQSDAPLKVAGGRWSGTKTQISDSDDERPEPSQVAPSEREEPVDHAQATIVPPKRMQSEALLGSDEPRLGTALSLKENIAEDTTSHACMLHTFTEPQQKASSALS